MAHFVKAAEIGNAGAMSLPGRYYTTPEILEQEQTRIFARRWLCAGRAELIPELGDYFVRNIGAESVIVVRGRDGIARAFYNVCRHRGTRICEQANGHFASNIRCPYHAWTYGLDGRLLGASTMDGVPGFDCADFPLHPVQLAIWEGFVFINLEGESEAFQQSHATLIGRFSRYNVARLRTARRIEYDVKANWKLILQNYSECYHCPVIHPALVKLSPADSGANDLIHGPFLGGYMTVNRQHGSMTQSGRTCSIPVGDLPDEDQHRVYYYTIFPNMLLSLHPDYVMAHTLWPESPDRTRVECDWLFHPDADKIAGFDPDDGVRFWDQTNREDWHICELSQLGVSSRAYTPGPYSPREGILAEIDRYYLEALGPVGNSTP